MKAIVDLSQRNAKRRAHTATHLLHAELNKIFPQTKQAGSLVDSDYLRFDFYADTMLDSQQIHEIEKEINAIIYARLAIHIDEMSFEEATKNLGAKAFFEDKYGDTVRVVRIGTEQPVSIELCGGTHCSHTGEIGAFVIVSQEAVASGIKRISAYTGPKVIEHYHSLYSVVEEVNTLLGVKNIGQTLDKLHKELKEKQELTQKLEQLNTKIISSSLANIENTVNKPAGLEKVDKIINISGISALQGLQFKNIVLEAKHVFSGQTILLYSTEGNFAILDSKNNQAKTIQTALGIRGGGNDNTVQGRDPSILEKI